MALDSLMEPREDPETLKGKWDSFLSSDENRSALLQFGLALMQPVGVGQTTAGHIGQAIGAGAEASGRVRQQDIELEEAQAKRRREEEGLDLRRMESGANIDIARSRLAGEVDDRALRRDLGEFEKEYKTEDLKDRKESRELTRQSQAEALRRDAQKTDLEKRRVDISEQQGNRRLDIDEGKTSAEAARRNAEAARQDQIREEKNAAAQKKLFREFVESRAKQRAEAINNDISYSGPPVDIASVYKEWEKNPEIMESFRRQFDQEVYRSQQPAPGVETRGLSTTTPRLNEGGDKPAPPPPAVPQNSPAERVKERFEDVPARGTAAPVPSSPMPGVQTAPPAATPRLSKEGNEQSKQPLPSATRSPEQKKPKWADLAKERALTSDGRDMGTWLDVVSELAQRYDKASPEDRIKIKQIARGGRSRVSNPELFDKYMKGLGIDLNE